MPHLWRIGEVGNVENGFGEMFRRALDGFFVRKAGANTKGGWWIGDELFHGVTLYRLMKIATRRC